MSTTSFQKNAHLPVNDSTQSEPVDNNNPKALKKVTFGLFIGSFISFCNLYLFQPLLPLIAEHYQVTAAHVNWVLAAATLTLSLSLLPWAIYSEKDWSAQNHAVQFVCLTCCWFMYFIFRSAWIINCFARTDGNCLGGLYFSGSGLHGRRI